MRFKKLEINFKASDASLNKLGSIKLSKEEVEEARGAPSPKNIQGPVRRYDSPLDSPKAIAAREKLRRVMRGIKKKDPDHPAVQNVKDK